MNSVERVKSLCKERKIPISRLEKDLGYSNGYIGQLRKGVFPANRLVEIAQYLSVSTEFLLTGTEKAPIPEDERQEELKKIAAEIREHTRIIKTAVDSTYNFYLSLRALAGGSMPIPHEIAFMPEQSASIDADIKKLITKFLETATPEEASDFWRRYDRIGQEFRKQMDNPSETPYPTPEEIETYGELAKNLVMHQFATEKRQDASASSAKESDVG